MTLPIWVLYLVAVGALTLIVAACLIPMISWSVQVVESGHRRRHAARRRARRGGYLPIHDEQWDPEAELAAWPRVNDGTYLQIPRKH